jgi:hypothetical protein
MPIIKETREKLTPREREELGWEKEATKLQIEHAEKISQMNLEVRKLEARWTQLFKLPMALIWLPIRLVMAFAIPISVISKKELPDKFWEFMKP